MNSITAETFTEIVDTIRTELSFLFDFTAVQALDLVDHRCVMLVNSQVVESYINFEKDQLMCKHKLAAILSTAMGLCKEVQYADETVTLMLVGENNSL
ncbi:hypothetical protein CEXT_522151 [Caerostris extrusa]|uniref:Uncharacterized protein n=1 Tax=Caerostris extrusa TaxID=172846 RepID=A0AAV4RY78_CAEEX|nr:hypothetical protein CEXT_522151 [Caerostris extrusa]